MKQEALFENNLFRVFRQHPGKHPMIVPKEHHRVWTPELAMAAAALANKLYGARAEDLQWTNDPCLNHPYVIVMLDPEEEV